MQIFLLFLLSSTLSTLEGIIDHQILSPSWFQYYSKENENAVTSSSFFFPTFVKAFTAAVNRKRQQQQSQQRQQCLHHQDIAREEEEEEESDEDRRDNAAEEEEEDDDKLLDDVKDFELTEDDFIEAIIDTQVPNEVAPGSDSTSKRSKDQGKGGGGSPGGSGDDGDDKGAIWRKGLDDTDQNDEDDDFDLSASAKRNSNKSASTTSQEAQQQYYSISTIKSLWKDFIVLPPNKQTIDELLQDTTVSSKLNGTDKESFYKQLLLQFLDPLHTTNNKNNNNHNNSTPKEGRPLAKKIHWLDQEFVLSLKGMAVLALYPEMKEQLLGQEDGRSLSHVISSKLTNTIRLISEKDKASTTPSANNNKQNGNNNNNNNNNPSGIYAIHQMIVKALAHSIQAKLVIVNQKTIEKIQELAERQGALKKYLSKATILASLFELSEEDQGGVGGPMIIAINDHCKWLFHNAAVSQTVLDELKNRSSRIFFIAMEPTDDIRVGNIPPSSQHASTASESKSSNNGPGEGDEQSGQGFSFPNFSSFFGPPGQAPGQSMPGANQPPPGFLPPGQVFPSLPPGANPMIFGRSFQVVIQNGTATMTPLPPGAMPMMPMLPPGAHPMLGMAPLPPLSDEQKKKMIADYEKFVEKEKKRNPDAPLPPEMNEEDIDDIQEFLKDPDNMARIKSAVESLLSNFSGFSQMFGFGKNGMPIQFSQNISGMLPPGTSLPPHTITQFRVSRLPHQPAPRGAMNKGAPAISHKPAPPSLPSSSPSSERRVYHKEDVDESSITSIGKTVIGFFEDVTVDAPRDHMLKLAWDRLIDEEICSRIIRVNRRLFQQELRKYSIPYDTGLFFHVDDLLKQQVLSRDQVKEIILLAIKLQAGRSSVHHLHSPQSHKLELSLWAVDSALSSIIKVSTPRLGKPMARSKEEMANLAMDKHERALVTNVISPQDIGVTYEMIGGLEEVKELLRQCITYPLKYPRLYTEGVAAEAVKGVLLYGPPGTGKTMLAKAVATEGGATFLSIDASTIENKWLGESEKNARAVFTLARKLAPCVVYLDEVDSILSSREHGDESSHGTLTSVKTTLMQEWDGLRTTNDRVVVIASTNRPFDLDEAVLRRLPRRIMVDLPDLTTRTDILAVTLSNNRIAPEVNFTKLAEQLEGYSGSDIKEVCREAVVRVAHERAQILEGKRPVNSERNSSIEATEEEIEKAEETFDVNAPLRPVTVEDFKVAMKKLKASVDDNGRELQKVVEWNEKYGELKRSKQKNKKSLNHLTMYI